MVPLWEPVFDELLEFVLLGDAAVGTRCPYCNEREKEREIKIPVHEDRLTAAFHLLIRQLICT